MLRYIDAGRFKESLKNLEVCGNDIRYLQGLQDAMDVYFPMLIDNVPTADVQERQSEWISVNERMPEDSGDYMVFNDGRIEIAPYDKEAAQEGFYPFGYEDKEIDEMGNTLIDWIEISGVTHWMPLPEPPKEV